jgi:hypothetical protein
MKSKINSKLISGLFAALFLICATSIARGQGNSIGSLATSGKVKVETSGTGETIGHVADLRIQNLTDQPLTCAVPPMILESGSEKNQDYACPRGQSVTLDPQQTKTVPMNGVCLNRNKPPVGKGVSGDLVINEANANVPQSPNSNLPATDASRLLQICTSKYEAADKLQKEGALKSLPYRDPQKQKDIVVQWSTWTDPVICQMTGSPPATKEDLREVVYKQVKEPMTPATKKKIDKGIDTIFEKVELTSAKAKELEEPGAVVAGPLSTVELTSEKAKDVEQPVAFFKPATVAQPGDVVHVEPQSPRDREGAPGAVGAKGSWMVKVKLPSGKVVEVWFETDDRPALEVCNWIKINETGTSASGKKTVVKDYEKTTAPTPTATPSPTPIPPTVPESKPPTVPESPRTPTPPSPLTPTPTAAQPPQPPGEKTEPEKPKDEGAKPGETLEPPFELPHWLEPWWEALKAGTGIVPTDLPGGKDALGLVIAKLNVEIRKEMAKGNDKKAEFYEDFKKKLQEVYNNMPDKK